MPNLNPKASIIIATHDRPQLLPRAVESARAAGTSVEIVVVDDASTDQTAQLCQTLSGIKYVRTERNQRVAGARNIGLVASCGEYISFLDDDDARLPGSLDDQIEALEREPQAGRVYAQAIWGDQQVETGDRSYPLHCPQGGIFWQILTRKFFPLGSPAFPGSPLAP